MSTKFFRATQKMYPNQQKGASHPERPMNALHLGANVYGTLTETYIFQCYTANHRLYNLITFFSYNITNICKYNKCVGECVCVFPLLCIHFTLFFPNLRKTLKWAVATFQLNHPLYSFIVFQMPSF